MPPTSEPPAPPRATAPRHGNRQKHESRNPLQQALIAHFHRRVVGLVKDAAPATILDVGCGEGYTLAALAAGGVRATLTGVDLSAEAIATARARLGDSAELSVQDARTLALEGRRFDLVMMTEVLEHLEDPAAVLQTIASLSARHVLLSVPWEPFFCGLNLLRGKNVARLGNDPEHVQHWTRRGFMRFIGERFEVLDAPVVFPWTLVLAAVRR
jgi:SAM-dependent methyltransferase